MSILLGELVVQVVAAALYVVEQLVLLAAAVFSAPAPLPGQAVDSIRSGGAGRSWMSIRAVLKSPVKVVLVIAVVAIGIAALVWRS